MNVTKEWVAQQAVNAAAPVTEGWKLGALTVWVPGKPWNPQGGDLRHHMKKARTVRAWRERTAERLFPHRTPGRNGNWPWMPAEAKRVTFTIYSRKPFDDDNLAAVCKPLRDAAVDMRLMNNDDPKSGHHFVYRQETRPKLSDAHGIAITIQLRQDGGER